MSANLTRQRRINTITAEYVAIGDIIVDAMGQDWEVKMFSSCKAKDSDRVVLTFGVERLHHALSDVLHYSPNDTVRVRNIHTREKEEVATMNQAKTEVSQRETPDTKVKDAKPDTEESMDGAENIDRVRTHGLISAYPIYSPEGISIRIDQSGYVDAESGKPALPRWEDISLDQAKAIADDIYESIMIVEDDSLVREEDVKSAVANHRSPSGGKGTETKSKWWKILPFNEEVHPALHEGKVGITSDFVGEVVGWFKDLATAEEMVDRLNTKP